MRTRSVAALLAGASLLLSGCGTIVGGQSPPVSPPQTTTPPQLPAPLPTESESPPAPEPTETPSPTPSPTPTESPSPTPTPNATPTPTEPPAADVAELRIVADPVKDGAYEPTTLTVAPGQQIHVVNDDRLIQHDARFQKGDKDEGGTEILMPGEEETVEAPSKAGTYELICTLHPRMSGRLVVEK